MTLNRCVFGVTDDGGKDGRLLEPVRDQQETQLVIHGADGTPLANVIDASSGAYRNVASPTRGGDTATLSCAITADGKLYCWGANDSYNFGLGLGDATGRPYLTRVTALAAPSLIAGVPFNYARDSSGSACAIDGSELKCWGLSFTRVAGNYGFQNVSSLGGLDRHSSGITYPRFLTSDGVFHLGMDPRNPACGALQ